MRNARGLVAFILPVGLIVVWQFASTLGKIPSYLASPAAIGAATRSMLADGELPTDIGISLYRALAGLVAGGVLGTILGLWAGVARAVERLADPLVSFTYPIPKIALLPIIFAWFGLGDGSKIVVIAMSVFYPMYLAAFYGAKATVVSHVWAARSMGASPLRIFLRIVVPSALPQIVGGLRIALAVSFIVMFTTELFAANSGLGYLVASAENGQRFDVMYVGIGAIAVLGFCADRVVLALRRVLVHGERRPEATDA